MTLSCLTHEGVPDKGFSFSWWRSKDLQISSVVDQTGQLISSQELSSASAKSLLTSFNTTHLAELFSNHMTQIPGHTGRHLMLDAIKVEQSGWYGCQVVSGGGTAQSLHLLLINCKLTHFLEKLFILSERKSFHFSPKMPREFIPKQNLSDSLNQG